MLWDAQRLVKVHKQHSI